jgi:hypothetical protein
MKRLLPLLLLLAGLAPRADAQIDPDGMKAYGGTWLADCSRPKGTKVTVFDNALVFLDGERRVATTNATLSASYYGNSPPENYEVTVFADMPDGDQMIFTVYQDKGGRWATIDGGGSVQKALGKPALQLRFRQCAAASAAPAAPAPATPAASAAPPADTASFPGPAQLAAAPAFATPYRKALGKLAKEQDWLLDLEGPSPDTRSVTVDGREYLVLQSCKAHDCADNNTTLFWNADKALVFGKVRAAGKSTMIGSPPPAVAKEIGNAWWKQWGHPPTD